MLSRRAFALSCVGPLTLTTALWGQASSYIPLDDPRLPALELLIARRDVPDPSPLVRPFTRADAVRALAAVDTASHAPAAAMVRLLLEEFRDPRDDPYWRVHGAAGAQAFSRARRDLLHPGGPDGIRPYAELDLQAVIGSLALVTRPAIEPRLTDDPDWPGRRDVEVAARQIDAYASAQFRWVRLLYGQLDRNWGPVLFPGIGLSDYGYGRPALALEVATRDFQFHALSAQLADERDSTGALVHRYHFAHRLGVRLSERFRLVLWETTVLSGTGRNFEDRYRNPLSISYLANTIGLGDRGNVMLGVDVEWRALGRTALQAQLALDDLSYQDRDAPDRNPDRWALTLSASGPFGAGAAWRAGYTRATSLAFRTFNPFENFTDAGVGIGRNFADHDQLTLLASWPLGGRWLVSPELTMLRQGEGRINDPYPSGTARGDTPQIFIGTVERTYRTAVRLNGWHGPLSVRADAGWHHIVNRQHLAGETADRFEARLQITVGLRYQGVLH